MNTLKKKAISELIAKDKIAEAFDIATTFMANIQDKETQNTIVILSNRYMQLSKEHRNATITESNFEQNKNKIIYSLLQTITSIPDPLENITFSNRASFLKPGLGKLIDFKKNNEHKFIIEASDIEFFLKTHLTNTFNWAKKISFKDSQHTKLTSKTYIDLDLYLSPKKQHIDSNNEIVKFSELINDCETNKLFCGGPGAGKTTTVKKIIEEVILKNGKIGARFNTAITIRLRELNISDETQSPINIITKKIAEIFNIFIFPIPGDPFEIEKLAKIKVKPKEGKNTFEDTQKLETEKAKISQGIQLKRETEIKNFIITFIDSINILIILDGFDELNNQIKRRVLAEIQEILLLLYNSRVILTSRTGEINIDIQNIEEYEIKSLTQDQQYLFAHKWLDNNSLAVNFVEQLANSPFSQSEISPLVLAHLCALYERYKKIPERPRIVYKKIINLLLEEWDIQRGVVRESSFDNFYLERKFEFLSHLAFELTTTYGKSIFNTYELFEVYKKTASFFNFPGRSEKLVLEEIESQTGIFIQTGYDKYEFFHKSIQEYLVAEYIVRLSNVPASKINILSQELAIAIAISSNPNLFFLTLVSIHFKKTKLTHQFIVSFINRMLLEKIDFSSDALLGFSIIYFWNLLKIYLPEYNLKLNSFNNLCQMPAIKASIKSLKQYYKVISSSDLKHEENLGASANDFPINPIFSYFHSRDLNENEILIRKIYEIENEYLVTPKFMYFNKSIWFSL